MSFNPYPSYRQLTHQWADMVPSHWNLVKLRRLTVDHRQGYYSSESYVDDGIRLLRITDLHDFGHVDFSGCPRLPYSDETKVFELAVNDFVFARTGGAGRFGRITSLDEPSIYASYLIRFRFSKLVESSYLCFVFACDDFQSAIQAHIHGGVNQNVHAEDIKEQSIPLPPVDEQVTIASFLDRETAKIDALVDEQERLIELLKEKRQAIVSHAVTKGLEPNAPMKDSGVEWLGEVPEHWEVMPVRKASRLESGHTPSRSHPEWWVDCNVPWFSLADVWQIRSGIQEYVIDTAERVSELGLANSSARLLPKGTVILSRTASVGYSAIMGVEMATTQDFANWVCGPRLHPEYLLYCFRGMPGEFERLRMGSTHNTIYMPDIASLTIAIPPTDEQSAIVTHIREETGRLDALVEDAKLAVTLLRERRSALISAAVTGKIDVRGFAQGKAEAA